MMKKLLSLLSILTLSTAAVAANTAARVERIDVLEGGKNLLINPSFDQKSFLSGWTATTITPTVETTNVSDGKQSANLSYSFTTGGISQSVTPTIQTNGMPMEATCRVKTQSTSLQVCSQANGVDQACTPVPATNTWQTVTSNFTGPADGTSVGVKVSVTNSTAGTSYVDDCYVGPARNLSQVSQAQVIGTVTMAATGCAWTSSSTTFAAMTGATGCTYATTGQAQAPAANTLGIKFATLPAGEYKIEYEGQLYNSVAAKQSYLQFTDGTNFSREISSYYSASGGAVWPSISQSISYSTAQSNVTFQVYGKVDAGGALNLYGTVSSPGVLRVYYFPSSGTATTALTSANNVASWSGFHASDCQWKTTSTTMTDPAADATCTFTETQNRNFGTVTSAGSKLPGITFTPPRTGRYYVCANTVLGNDTASLFTGAQLTDGTTIIGTGNGRYPSYVSAPICGIYNVASLNPVTLKIQLQSEAGSSGGGIAPVFSGHTVDWSIFALDGMGGPVILPATASSGATNYLTGGDGESGANVCTPYANTAAVAPTTGAGGSPTVGCSLSSTSPISGNQSYVLTKPASNVQGQGWSFPFTVDAAAQAKMLQVSFDYQVDSNYTVGSDTSTPDIVAYVYGPLDGTPQLTQLTPYKALGGSGTLKFQGNLQTAASGKAYRLILHEPNTGTLASSIKVDNIVVSPVLRQFGTPVTDWQAYTPASSAGFGNITSNLQWRRNGSSVDVRGTFVCGTSVASEARISLPSVTSDSGLPTISQAGTYIRHGNTSNHGGMALIEPGVSYATFSDPGTWSGVAAAGGAKSVGNSICSSGETISVNFSVPVSGWSSSTQMSDQSGDNRIVSFTAQANTNQTVGTGVNLHFPDNISDSHGAWNGTDTYKIPVPGDYYVTGSVTANTPAAGDLYLYKNGSTATHLTSWVSTSNCYNGGALVRGLKAGDLLTFQHSVTTATFVANGGLCNNVGIFRLSGNQQIQASESVSAKYWASANGTANSTTPINFDSKLWDTHNAVTTGASWKFTAPSPGKYALKAFLNNSTAPSGGLTITLWKNGVQYETIGYATATFPIMSLSSEIQLLAGDYIELRSASSSYPWYGGGGALAGAACWIAIDKVAN